MNAEALSAERPIVPAGYARASRELVRARGRVYTDHLVRETGEHADATAVCGARPERRSYWTFGLAGGRLCRTCVRGAVAPAFTATRSPTSLEEEAAAFCAVEGTVT